MTTSADILDLVHATLTPQPGGAPPTAAGARVKRPGDLSTQQDQYPILKLRIVSESRQAIGHGSVQYITTTTIRVVGETSAPALLSDPSVSTAEAALWSLKRQVETAIINSYPLFRVVQQLVSVQTQLAFSAEATHLAGIQSEYAFEFYEGAEDFAPIASTDVDVLEGPAPTYPDAGLMVAP